MNDNIIFKNELYSGYLVFDNSVVLVNFVINVILIFKVIVGKLLVQIVVWYFEDFDILFIIYNVVVQFGCFRMVFQLDLWFIVIELKGFIFFFGKILVGYDLQLLWSFFFL